MSSSQARRFVRQMNDRSFDFGWRERGACFVEKLTLESFKSYMPRDATG